MLNVLLVYLFVTTPAPAESILSEPSLGGDVLSVRGIGMGGAERATATNVDALFLNPAGMSMVKHYVVEGDYSYNQAGNDHRPTASLIDSDTTVVAAGSSYNFERRFNSGYLTLHRVHFALSYAISIISIGVGVKYQNATRPVPPPSGTKAVDYSLIPTPVNNYSGVTGDIGVVVTPIQQLSLAAIGYNLIPTGKGGHEFAPLAFGAGAAAHLFSALELDADAVVDFHSLLSKQIRLHFGGEYTIVNIVPVRAGFIVDRIGGDNFWSIGAGYTHPRFGIDVGFRQAVALPKNRTFSIGFHVNVN